MIEWGLLYLVLWTARYPLGQETDACVLVRVEPHLVDSNEKVPVVKHGDVKTVRRKFSSPLKAARTCCPTKAARTLAVEFGTPVTTYFRPNIRSFVKTGFLEQVVGNWYGLKSEPIFVLGVDR